MRIPAILASAGIAALMIGAGAQSANAAPATTVPGGTNYNWYKLDGCNREPYGVVRNYDEAKATIDQQLEAIYQGGQRRLNIGIFSIHGLSDGTLMNSAGGKLTAHDRKNLADLLAEMKKIGFPKVVLTMNPQGQNLPTNTDYNPAMYAENYSFLKDVRSVAVASGEPYTLDLYDEGIPENNSTQPGQVNALNYSKKMWADYTKEFGKADTMGFSIIGGDPLRFGSLAKVYGNNRPSEMNLHFYGPPNFKNSEHDQFVTAAKDLHAAGFNQPWIIGETYYNDATSAKGIRQAINETGQSVLWVSDWQLSRANPKHCDQVDTVPPSDYSAFAAQGFDPMPAGKPDTATTTAGTYVETDVLANDKAGAPGLPVNRNTLEVLDPATGKWGGSLSTKQGTTEVTVASGDSTAGHPIRDINDIGFTPAKGFTGKVAPITYRAADSSGDLLTSTLTVTVKPATAPSSPPSSSSPSSTPSAKPTTTTAPTTSSAPTSTVPSTTATPPSSTAIEPISSSGNHIDSGLGANASSSTDWSRLGIGLGVLFAALAGATTAIVRFRRRQGDPS